MGMINNMVQFKMLSMFDGNTDNTTMICMAMLYVAYKYIKANYEELKIIFNISRKKYIYHLKLIYILPGSYTPGKIERNIINEAIFFDLHQHKADYDIPEYDILSSDFREELYIYIPDHNRFTTIKLPFDKYNLYLNNVTSSDNDDGGSADKPMKDRITFKFELYSYDSMDHLDRYIKLCQSKYKEHKEKELNKDTLIYRHIKDSRDDGELVYNKSIFSTNKTFSNLILDSNLKKQIMNGLDNFHNKPEIYKKYGSPHKLGILLYGPPGTGKTSVIKAVIQYARQLCEMCHVFDIDLSKISSKEEANNIFLSDELKGNILVLEEFDQASCVKMRKEKVKQEIESKMHPIDMDKLSKMDKDAIIKNLKLFQDIGQLGPCNKSSTSSLSVEDFLKIFDGIHEMTDVIFLATTNHIEDIDPAVLRRFDIKIKLDYHSENLVKEQLELYYGEKVLPPIILPHNVMTGCQVEQICKSCSGMKDAISEIHMAYLH